MSFISFGTKKRKRIDKKLPPHSAWGHYRVRRGPDGADHSPSFAELGKTLLRVDDVTLAYEGREVISSLSFEIPRGAYVSVIGENGTGKSTLLGAILGLKRVRSGKIELCDLKRREIGFLAQQNEESESFPATVYEVVLTGCLSRSSCGPFITKRARDIAFANMEKVGITSLSGRSCDALSGGQRQRVMLARALCSASKLLVLDEAVTGVDSKTVADIYSLVESLNAGGMTVLSVTHDISAAVRYSSHILRLSSDGYFFGTVNDYLALDEAAVYRKTDVTDKNAKEPYGDGGFRYKGGAV